MAFLDQIGSILDQYKTGQPPDRERAQAHYDEISKAVPPDVLASTIGPALGDLDSQHLEQRVEASAAAMTPDQRGSLVQSILGGLAGAGAGGGLASILQRIGASPAIATNPASATPQDVAKVTTYAKENQPDIFHKAMGFYAQHPTLVKVLGTLAIASIAKNLAGGRRPGLL